MLIDLTTAKLITFINTEYKYFSMFTEGGKKKIFSDLKFQKFFIDLYYYDYIFFILC